MKRRVGVCSLFLAVGVFLLNANSASASGNRHDPRVVSLESLNSALLGSAGGGGDDIRAIAQQRHARLQELVSSDPAEVLRLAISPADRLSLAAPIRGFVEEPVELDGTVDVLYEDRPDGSRMLHYLDADRDRFQLVFTTAAPRMLSGETAHVRGVRIDHTIVVDPSAENLRVGAATQGMQAVDALPNTFGAQRTVVLLVNFTNNPTQPYTLAAARSVVFTTTSNFDLENSYGQTWLTGDVFGWFTIPVQSSVCDDPSIETYAKSAATAAGVNLANYTHLVYAFPQNACSWWGLGSVGGAPTRAWINGSFELQVVAHEMGHNFGL